MQVHQGLASRVGAAHEVAHAALLLHVVRLAGRCMVPADSGVTLGSAFRAGLWEKYHVAAPRQRQQLGAHRTLLKIFRFRRRCLNQIEQARFQCLKPLFCLVDARKIKQLVKKPCSLSNTSY